MPACSANGDGFAVDQDFAAWMGVIGTRQKFHQRKLACAVLAHQRQHFAPPGLELKTLFSAFTPGKVLEMLRISSRGVGSLSFTIAFSSQLF